MAPRLSLRLGELVWRTIDGEVVALNLATSQYVSVNDSGSVLWARLEKTATREELASALVDHFDVGVDVARADVDEFVDALHEAGLIQEGAED